MEAQLFVIVGADPFGGVDRALFQRRIDLARRDLLRHHAQLSQHHPGNTADPDLQTLQVRDRL